MALLCPALKQLPEGVFVDLGKSVFVLPFHRKGGAPWGQAFVARRKAEGPHENLACQALLSCIIQVNLYTGKWMR